MKYLFDTNHAIVHPNGDTCLAAHLSASQIASDAFAIWTIVLGELYYGPYANRHVSENLAKLAAFAAQLIVVDFDSEAGSESGKIKADQRSKGKSIPTPDAQIVASCSHCVDSPCSPMTHIPNQTDRWIER